MLLDIYTLERGLVATIVYENSLQQTMNFGQTQVFLQNIDLYYHSSFTAQIDYSVNTLKQKLMTLKYLSLAHITVIAGEPCLQNSIIHICYFFFGSADYKRFSVLSRLLTEYTDAVWLELVNIVGFSGKCWS